MADRLKVLIIAEAANPEWVSVPLVGWNLASALRQVANVHIVTQIRNREAFLRQGLVEDVDFTAIDSEALAAPFYKAGELLRGGSDKGWTTVTALQSLSYPYFEYLVWRRFGKQIKDGQYDIVHRVTPLSPTSPSSLAKRCRKAGVPFLLGPLNGGLPWHPDFDRERRKEREWLSYVRKAYALLPAIRATYRNASAIIAASRHTYNELSGYDRPMFYVPENGIDLSRFTACQKSWSSPLRLIFVGRLVPLKGVDMVIEACLHLLKRGKAVLDIVGDGPEMEPLQALARNYGVETAVNFVGWKPQAEVVTYLQSANILLFPSVRDFGGGVVLEAMACGTVPVVADYGGPGELVDADSGFALHMGNRKHLILQLKTRMTELVNGEHDLAAMSKNARARVETLYSWNAKAEQVLQIYHWLLTAGGDRPDFGFLEKIQQ
jgi:glycosyltransferase involved in cell wall biosynthesis